MATAAQKTAAEKQINEIETALEPVVVKMNEYLDEGDQPVVPANDDIPFPQVRQETSSLYQQIRSYLGFLRTHQIMLENEKKSGS